MGGGLQLSKFEELCQGHTRAEDHTKMGSENPHFVRADAMGSENSHVRADAKARKRKRKVGPAGAAT